MNKILIDKKIICDNNDIDINGNEITFKKSGIYEVEYVIDGKYELTFNISSDITLLETSFNRKLDINNRYVIKNGNLKIYKFYDNLSVNEIINIDLCTKESKVDYKFSNICHTSENYVININHLARETISNINNKSVGLNNSKIDFIINSNVIKEAIKCELSQNTRIVTMGECHAKISPNMFTPLDDVMAKHGSIIGTFKEEDIFYLMSKGISYNDTLKLMIKGYLLSNIDILHEVRKKIMDIIDRYWR